MLNKKILLAFFVSKDKIMQFLSSLTNEHKINLSDIHAHTIDGNDNEYLVSVRSNKQEKFKSNDKTIKPILVHVKNSCLFSINALNKYIEEKNKDIDKNNLNHKAIGVDWTLLKDKLLLLQNNELRVSKLYKIRDMGELFR